VNREDKNVGLILPELGGDQLKAARQAVQNIKQINCWPHLKETMAAFLGEELTTA